jgi:uncharacterized repeat protein (TIGR01451 family)
LTKSGSDATTGSTATSNGTPGVTRTGDTINWVMHYRNTSGGPAVVGLMDPLGANHTFVSGSLHAPPGFTAGWSTDGGSSYTSTEPSSGVNAIQAVGTSVDGSTGAQSLFSPPLASFNAGASQGDGWEALFVGADIYNVHHHTFQQNSGGATVLDCHVAATGAECPGYPGVGQTVPTTAGTPLGAAQPPAQTIVTAFHNNAATYGGRIYFASAIAGTTNIGVSCADTSNNTSCGYTQLGTSANATPAVATAAAQMTGGAQVGSKYYTLGYSNGGPVYCFDMSTNTPCNGWNNPSSAPGFTAGSYSAAFTLDSWGGYIFTQQTDAAGTVYLGCVIAATGALCPGWATPKQSTGNGDSLAPITDATGTLTGICVSNTSGLAASYRCYNIDGTVISGPAPFASVIPAGDSSGLNVTADPLLVGTRLYQPWVNSGGGTGGFGSSVYTCWDYATNSACQGFTPVASGNTSTQAYSIRQDPNAPDCLWELGNGGAFEAFSATFGGSVGCNEGNASVQVTPSQYYCDGQPGHVTSWSQLQIYGLSSSQYDALAVTITDANGNPILGWTHRVIPSSQVPIDISSIPYSGATTTLNVQVVVDWGQHAVAQGAAVAATFSGDPVEVCFQTKVGPSVCQGAPPVITNNGSAVTTAAGTATTDNSGPATFNEAVDTSLCQPSDSIRKIADAANGDQRPIKRGEKIQYSYLVTNTGNVNLRTVSVNDPLVSGVSCPTPAPPGLAPGASERCTATSPYIVSQKDVDAGHVTDTATVGCTDQYGQPCPAAPPSSTTVPGSPTPTVAVDKTAAVTPAADQQAAKVGDSIQYTYTVTNTGNVDLVTVAVSDPTEGAVVCPIPAVPGLAPGASETCTAVATHTVTQADVDAGQIADTATATGTDIQGTRSPTSAPSTVVVPTVQANAMTSIKKIANASNGDQAQLTVGETIEYSYLVTNVGSVDLSTVAVSDPSAGAVTCPKPAAPGLAPGQSELCTANTPYTVTQADVNNGSVTDTATSSGIDPRGHWTSASPPSSTTVPASAAPTVAIDKHAAVSPAVDLDKLKVGDKIDYSYTVTNTGNVTLTSVSVADVTVGAVSCPTPAAPGLAPGDSVTCTGASPHVVMQADVDAGEVTDTATAKGIDSQDQSSAPSDPSTVTSLTVAAAPRVTVVKTAIVRPGRDRRAAKVGDRISYRFKVTNIGNVDLRTVAVSDPVLGPVKCPVLAAPGLAPGRSVTCRGERMHLVTAADVRARNYTNVAVATGTDTKLQVSAVSRQARAKVRTGRAMLRLVKTVSRHVVRAGNEVIYHLKVSNPTAIAIADVRVCDRLPLGIVYVRASPRTRLNQGQHCWSYGILGAHASRTITLVTRALSGAGGRRVNYATATGNGVSTARAHQAVRIVRRPKPATPVTG